MSTTVNRVRTGTKMRFENQNIQVKKDSEELFSSKALQKVYEFIDKTPPGLFAISGGISFATLVPALMGDTKKLRRGCGIVSLATGLFAALPFIAVLVGRLQSDKS